MGGRRWFVAFVLLVLIVAAGGFIYLYLWPSLRGEQDSNLTELLPARPTQSLIDLGATATIEALATLISEPSPTPLSISPIPPPAPSALQLVRPNSASQFALSDFVALVWRWPDALQPGQQFTIYVRTESAERAIGTVVVPTSPTFYHLQVVGVTIGPSPGVYYWLVRLEDRGTGTILAESEARPIVLVGGAGAPLPLSTIGPGTVFPTPTPRPITPTWTPLAITMTPTATPTIETPTATVAPSRTPAPPPLPTWTNTPLPTNTLPPPPPTATQPPPPPPPTQPPPPPTATQPPPPPPTATPTKPPPPTATPPLPPTATPPLP